MPDVYPFGINPNHSVMCDTPCTIEQGCCGCDNCVGNFEDIRKRLDAFARWLKVRGWARKGTLGDVPQGFEDWEFWSRTPSYTEFLVEIIVAVNAGARGIVSWADLTRPGTNAAASQFAGALPELTPFLLSSPLSSPPVYYAHVITTNRLDFGLWVSSEGKVLVMAANSDYFPASIALDEVLSVTQFEGLHLENPRLVVDGGAKIEGTLVKFNGAVLSGAWIFG